MTTGSQAMESIWRQQALRQFAPPLFDHLLPLHPRKAILSLRTA